MSDTKMQIKFAELHNGLFVAGCNLDKKLDPARRRDTDNFTMTYDYERNWLVVTFKDETVYIPTANVAYMIPGVPEPRKTVQGVTRIIAKTTAQVETPQSHVFAGAGAGKTGKG